MARELVVQTWCDVCLAASDSRVPSTAHYQLGHAGKVLGLDVCESHAATLGEAWETFTRFGAPPEAEHRFDTPAAPRGNTAKSGGDYPCPICQPPRYFKTPAHVRAHLRSLHALDAAEYARVTGRPYNPHPCRWCAFEGINRVGLLAHIRSTHPGQYAASQRSGTDPAAPPPPEG